MPGWTARASDAPGSTSIPPISCGGDRTPALGRRAHRVSPSCGPPHIGLKLEPDHADQPWKRQSASTPTNAGPAHLISRMGAQRSGLAAGRSCRRSTGYWSTVSGMATDATATPSTPPAATRPGPSTGGQTSPGLLREVHHVWHPTPRKAAFSTFSYTGGLQPRLGGIMTSPRDLPGRYETACVLLLNPQQALELASGFTADAQILRWRLSDRAEHHRRARTNGLAGLRGIGRSPVENQPRTLISPIEP